MSYQSNAAEKLPENPTKMFIGTVRNIDTTVQAVNDRTINDGTIFGLSDLANKLEATSGLNNHIAGINEAAQITNEHEANMSASGAGSAQTEQELSSKIANAGLYDMAAEMHHNKSHSALAKAQDTGAAARGAADAAKIKIITQEAIQRQERGIEEVEIRTQAGVSQEMRSTGAVIEEQIKDQYALEIDNKLKLADPANAPKFMG